MMGTAQRVIDALAHKHIKQTGKGKYVCNSPYRADSDSMGFSIKIDDEERGTWHDFVTNESGSLYDLAKYLGITPERSERAPVATTKRAYADLDEYARAHGLTADDLKAAEWSDVEQFEGRPALRFKTAGGYRVRFIDGQSPKYKHAAKGYKACWYGLKRATGMLTAQKQKTGLAGALVVCNGEVSTITAQKVGIPACAITGGEGNYNELLVMTLLQSWQGEVWIALDCDEAGRNAAEKLRGLLPNARVIDLMLGDGGDLADFCMLHTHNSAQALGELVEKQSRAQAKADVEQAKQHAEKKVMLTSYEVASRVFDYIDHNISNPAEYRGLLTGLTGIDRMTWGLEPGWVVIILGATNMGKSMLATRIARGLMELQPDVPGVICPTEMTAEAWSRRTIAAMAKVNPHGLRTGMLTPQETSAVTAAVGRFSKQRTYYIDLATPTIDSIWKQLRTAKAEGAQWVLIDSLQELQARREALPISDAMRDVSKSLHSMILDTQLVAIVTSQITRDVSKLANKRPTIESGSGSSEIEKKADVMLGLYDHQYYVEKHGAAPDPEWIDGTVEVILLKHRHEPSYGVPKAILRKTPYGFENAELVRVDVSAGEPLVEAL